MKIETLTRPYDLNADLDGDNESSIRDIPGLDELFLPHPDCLLEELGSHQQSGSLSADRDFEHPAIFFHRNFMSAGGSHFSYIHPITPSRLQLDSLVGERRSDKTWCKRIHG